MSLLLPVGISVSRSSNPTRSATFSAHSVCFGLERPVAAVVFDVVGAYVTVP